MTLQFSISEESDKLQVQLKRALLLDNDFLLSNDEIKNIQDKITEIFNNESNLQLYVEICTINKLNSTIIDFLSKQITSINMKGVVDISFIMPIIKNDFTALSFIFRRVPSSNSFFEIRVASTGNVDSGKSTILSVLTTNVLDNGKGSARVRMFRYRHERDSGMTSSIGNSSLSVDSLGKFLEIDRPGSRAELELVPSHAFKVFDFIDLAGHEKYLKTTILGLVGLYPDYIMLIIGSNRGLAGTSKGLSLALEIPVFFVMTKIDICPENIYKDTLRSLVKILRSSTVKKNYIVIKSKEDVLTAFVNLNSNQLYPIFEVSSVTGQGLDFLRMFLSLIPRRRKFPLNEPFLFSIDDMYRVPGIGCVVSGILIKGIVNKDSNILLGPDSLGNFQKVRIKSIHRKRCLVDQLVAGQAGSFALHLIAKENVRKGMVLLDSVYAPLSHWEFKAMIYILHHQTTIRVNYQALGTLIEFLVHVGPVRQSASIIWMKADHLKTGDKAEVIMRFMIRPEFILPESKMIFREGRTKAVGVLIEPLCPVTIDTTQTLKTDIKTKKNK